MRQIFKNYLATFIKNWLQTIGTVLFILLMAAIVIGMLAAPVQINSKINSLNSNNIKYDKYLQTNVNRTKLSSKFLYDYAYNDQDFEDNGKEIIEAPKDGVLSSLFKYNVSQEIGGKNNSTDPNVWDDAATFIRDGINAFTSGPLLKTQEYFQLTGPKGEVLPIWKSVKPLLASNVTDFLTADVTIKNGSLVINSDTMTEGDFAGRVYTRIYNLLTINGVNVTPTYLSEQLSNPKNIANPGDMVVNMIDSYITTGDVTGKTTNPKPVDNFKYYLSSFQVFSTSMYKTLSLPIFNYDFDNYVVQSTLNELNNTSAWTTDNNGDKTKNFNFQIEHQSYFNKTTTQSLFPSFAIDLKTVNAENETNQLQLESGRRPQQLTPDQIKDIVNGGQNAITPEIVLSSGYMSKNNLHIGDYIEIPDGVQHNNVVGPQATYDNYFTSAIKFKIVGEGEKYDDVVPGSHYTPFMEDIKNYTAAYVDDNVYNFIANARWNNSSSSSNITSYIRIIDAAPNLDVENAFRGYDNSNLNTGVWDNNNSPFVTYDNSKTSSSLSNTKITVIIYVMLGVVVLILAFVFIMFIIKKELNETRRQIGIFKSFGYKISELSWIFAVKTFITIFVGEVLGYIISIPLQIYSANGYESSVMFHYDKIFANGGFIVIIFIAIPAVFLLISYLATLLYLREPTLSLLSNGSKVSKGKTHASPLTKLLQAKNIGFGYRLQKSFIKTGYGKFIVVEILFGFAALIFTMMFGAQTMMYAVADQGFSSLTDKADHNFAWKNPQAMNINYGNNKYSMDDLNTYQKQNFTYNAYNSKDPLSDVLNNNKQTSDSRFRANYLVSSISNTFSQDRSEAISLLLPNNYWYHKLDSNWETDITGEDANIPDAFKDTEMAYGDYFLNWILTVKITGDNLKQQEIDYSKNNDNSQMNLNNLRAYTSANGTKINMQSIMNGDPAALAQFADTLFGLSDIDSSGLKNNLFLSDITKIITLELAQSYAETQLTNTLTNDYGKQSTYTKKQIDDSIAKVGSTGIMGQYDPNNPKYWGMTNNPLVDLSSLAGDTGSKNGADSSTSTGGGLSLSKLSGQTVSLIMAAAMLGNKNDDINKMPTITVNEMFFNSDDESLFYQLPLTDVDSSQFGTCHVVLHDYSKDSKQGNWEASLNHDGVSLEQYQELTKENPAKNTINAIIPYGLSKVKDLKIGDNYQVNTGTKSKQPIILHVVGINKSVSVSFGTGWNIFVDYNTFRHKFFDDNMNKELDNTPIFNSLTSNEKMLDGNVDVKDIAGSINSMKYVGQNLALSIQPGSSIFGSIFNGMVDFSKLLGLQVDPNFTLVTNPNVASTSNLSSVVPYNILRVGTNSVEATFNNILILFMVLVAVLLLIILVVVMNIIIDEATPIILTLKSLGYSPLEINWITMGSYVIWAVVGFIVAYVLSLVIWIVFLQIVGSLWHIYIFMSFSWQAPVITFLVIAAILFIGWYVSNWKVQKIPLTLVTGFN